MVVGARQIFNFSGKKPGFLKAIELCLIFCMGFCITQLALSNHNNNISS